MANWLLPDEDELYTDILGELNDRDTDAATMFFGSSFSNIPVHSIRWNRATSAFQEWDGATWNDLASGLTLGTMSAQDSNNVNITGGVIGTAVNIDAARLTSNLVATARLGGGAAGVTTFLRGDQTWAVPLYQPIGSCFIWMTAAAPTNHLLLNGQAVSRATYADLFALWGVTFGPGNGTTTFNVPDMRGFFPFGKSAAGTGSVLGGTFGAIDHVHTGPSHTHTVAAHNHTGPSHTHTISVDGDHQHGVTGSTDGVGDHTHDYSGSGTTSTESGALSDQFGVSHNSIDLHSHTFSWAGTTTSNGSHSHTLTNPTAFTNVIGNHSHTGATGAAGTGNTGNASPATDAQGTGNTGTANPPGFAVNFIVRAL